MHYEQVPFPLLFSASRGFVGPAPLGGSCPEVPSLEGPRTDGVPLAVRARYRCQDVFVLQTVPADSLRGTPRLHRWVWRLPILLEIQGVVYDRSTSVFTAILILNPHVPLLLCLYTVGRKNNQIGNMLIQSLIICTKFVPFIQSIVERWLLSITQKFYYSGLWLFGILTIRVY